MSTLPTVVLTVAGLVMIAAALRDVFDTLFHESGRAVVSRVVMRTTWRAFRGFSRGRPERFAVAGPTALLAVVVTWLVLLVFGWALVVLPHVPEDFGFQRGAHLGRFVDALYFSLVTITTVGFGDITPHAGWLRLVTPLEALVGFGLLTATVSWLLSIYPVLSRRRSLAYEIHLLLEAERRAGGAVLELGDETAIGVYSELTSRLVAVERDLVTFPVAYYFSEPDERFSLPAVMPALLELAERGTSDEVSGRVRLRAEMLREAIDDFAATTAHGFHGSRAQSTREVLDAYAHDHLRAGSAEEELERQREPAAGTSDGS